MSPIKNGEATICNHPIDSVISSNTRKIPPSVFCMSFFPLVTFDWFVLKVTPNVLRLGEGGAFEKRQLRFSTKAIELQILGLALLPLFCQYLVRGSFLLTFLF